MWGRDLWDILSVDIDLSGRIIKLFFRSIEEFYCFCRWLEERWCNKISNLVEYYLDYDMPMFVYTHAAMSRRIERLKNLLYILGNENITESVYRGDSEDFVHCRSVFLDEILSRFRFNDIINVLKAYEDEIHRVRDKVHRFIYPILRSRLETLQNIHGVFEYGKLHMEIECHYNRIFYDVDVLKWGKLEKHITDDKTEFYKILDKMLNRRNKKIEQDLEVEILHKLVKVSR